MEYTIREMTVMEYPLLNEFLYEAIFIPDGIKPPPKNIIASPELQIYVDRFGASKADLSGYVLYTITDILMMKHPLLPSLYTKNTGDRG